jgi:hypothetical protein
MDLKDQLAGYQRIGESLNLPSQGSTELLSLTAEDEVILTRIWEAQKPPETEDPEAACPGTQMGKAASPRREC